MSAGYRVLKVKLGCADPDLEVARLTRLARGLPLGVRLRLDANGAWDQETAERVIVALNGLPVESLEEPLTRPDPVGLIKLQALASFPLALDESLPGWMPRLGRRPFPVRRAVIKPAVIGGVGATLRLARRLRDLGIEMVLTGLVDSAAGLWATAQVAAAVGSPAPTDSRPRTGWPRTWGRLQSQGRGASSCRMHRAPASTPIRRGWTVTEGPFAHAFEVRLHDTDAAGVLFFAHLFRHAHDAYESLMAAAGFPLQDLIRNGTALPIVHAEADYQAPMRQGDRIRVAVGVAEIRRRSFSLDYRFLDEQGLLRARARTVHVLIGADTTMALPDDLRQALARWRTLEDPGRPSRTPQPQ